MNRKEKIYEFLKENIGISYNFSELCLILGINSDADKEELKNILHQLLSEQKIMVTKKKRYKISRRSLLFEGEFIGHDKGFGFINSTDFENDIFVSPDDVNTALNGDTVLFRVYKEATDAKRAQGEVVKVVNRKNLSLVGTFYKNQNFGFVVADNKKMDKDIFISKKNFNSAKDGQKVVCSLTSFGGKGKNPEGRIDEIIGFANEGDNDIVSVIKQYELSEEFPQKVIENATKVNKDVTNEEIEKRLDLRDELIITIDGDDAKDLDDAISLDILENGNYRLGVHIADVSYYVKDRSPLDEEAFTRGTSVYLVDRVIPMLPKELSNGICSLHGGVDRLTLSIFMEIDVKGKVVDYKIKNTVINSKARMTYKNVTGILEGDKELTKKYEFLVPLLNNMDKLAMILRKKRRNRGSLDFNFPECSIVLDENNKPIEIKKYELTTSNYIIEEFMLIANETIAEYVFWQQKPFVYRVHEEPDMEKMERFIILAKNLGYSVKGQNGIQPKELLKVLEECKGKKEEKIISTVMLRSLMKAKYSPENKGHFGLAAKYYCHFTSPIRRYPDLIIHRIIKLLIDNKLDDNLVQKYVNYVEKAATQSTQCEQIADNAERDSQDIKKAEYMSGKIGEEFEGIISSVTNFGIFVELDNTIEGLIRYKDISGDYFEFNEREYSAYGRASGRKFTIGDVVKVRVASANKLLKEIDFELC